jgi:hypothetical protein
VTSYAVQWGGSHVWKVGGKEPQGVPDAVLEALRTLALSQLRYALRRKSGEGATKGPIGRR